MQPPADCHRPLAHCCAEAFGYVAYVADKPQTPKRLGDTPWWMVRWPVGEAAVVVLWLSQWTMEGPRARSRVRVEGDVGFALVEGHEHQVGLAGFVPEGAFAVDPGASSRRIPKTPGFCAAVGGFDFGAAGEAGARDGAEPQVEADSAAGLAEGDGPGVPGDDGTMAKAPLVTQEALQAFTDRLVEAFAPERVILFGSMARGTAGLESDADVLVVMPFEGRALEKILEIREVCDPEFPLDMLLWRPEDIARRYRWGDPFIRAALDHGVVLHG